MHVGIYRSSMRWGVEFSGRSGRPTFASDVKAAIRLLYRLNRPTEHCLFLHLRSEFLVPSYVYSKQPVFGLTQEWLKEVWSPRQGICLFPLCGIFDLPWHRHQIEETNGF